MWYMLYFYINARENRTDNSKTHATPGSRNRTKTKKTFNQTLITNMCGYK